MRWGYISLLAVALCCSFGPPPDEEQEEGEPEEVAATRPADPGEVPPVAVPEPSPSPNSREAVPAAEPPPATTIPPSFISPTDLPRGHLHRASLRQIVESRIVRQVSAPAELFERIAGTEVATIDDGLLVCRVVVTSGSFDDRLFAGGADVYMFLQTGSGRGRRTPQRSGRVYSFPIGHLETGDDLRVTVMDQDLLSDDTIGRGSAPYAGGETDIHAGAAEVRCRPVPAERITAGRARAMRELDAAIARLGTARPDLTRATLGYPADRATDVIGALRNAVGWFAVPPPEIDERITRAADFETSWEAALGAAVTETVARLPAPETPIRLRGSGRVHVSAPLCGEEAEQRWSAFGERPQSHHDCALTVTLNPTARGTLWTHGRESLSALAVTEDGETTALRIAGAGLDADGNRLSAVHRMRPGQAVTFLYPVPDRITPQLVRVTRRGHAALMRAR